MGSYGSGGMMNKLREILGRLSTMGDEPWKTSGHPMNDWVQKETVQRLAKEALGILDKEEL